MKRIELRIDGVSPLLMHATGAMMPGSALADELRKLTSTPAKKKTAAIMERIAWLEFHLGLHSEDGVIGVPEVNIIGVIRDGAGQEKMGKAVTAAVMIEPAFVPLIYKGPRDADALFEIPEFRDGRIITVNRGSKVYRTRPRFNVWALAFVIEYDEMSIAEANIRNGLEYGGRMKGLGDYRPRFGRFKVTTWNS